MAGILFIHHEGNILITKVQAAPVKPYPIMKSPSAGVNLSVAPEGVQLSSIDEQDAITADLSRGN